MSTITKYPRLIMLLKHQCSLTLTEAEGVLTGRIGEAASHYGGREACLRDAIHARHRLFKQFNGSPLEFWFFRRDRSTLKEMRF